MQSTWTSYFKCKSPPPSLVVYCFTPSGAGCSAFFKFSNQVEPHVQVIGVRLPGRETRLSDPVIESVDDLVSRIVDTIFRSMNSTQFIFIGVSFGAVLAFEVARALHKLSLPLPKHVILCSKAHPSIPKPFKINFDCDDATLLHQLYDILKTPTLEWCLHERDVWPLIVPSLRANFKASQSYEYKDHGEPLPIPITLIHGEKDHLVSLDSMSDWKKETSEACNHVVIPNAPHLFLDQPDFFSIVNEIIKTLV